MYGYRRARFRCRRGKKNSQRVERTQERQSQEDTERLVRKAAKERQSDRLR